MKRILMIIAPRDFRDEELFEPKEIFEKAGHSVTVASTKTGTIKGMLGGTVNVSTTIDKIDMKDFDGLIFVGGMGTEELFENPRAHKLAKDASASSKPIGAICIAPSILAKSGVLKGKNATVWAGEKYKNILKESGAILKGEEVVRDGKIVTANGPKAAKKFATTFLTLFGNML
ncbi:MAG: DJ-1/PfpI family protein [Thermoplasmata archaeon]